MKKIIIYACFLLITAVSIGFSSVSALSIGDFIGADIGSIVDSFLTTEQTTTAYVYPDGENDLNGLLERLDIASDVTKVTDLIRYLTMGGSIDAWIYDNYGYETEIPDSVKAMSPDQLILYLLGSALNPTQPQPSTGYTFVPSEETKTQNETQSAFPSSEYASSEYTTSDDIPDSSVPTTTAPDYITGDVNGDGKVTAQDARLALRASSQLIALEGTAFLAADVNGDNRITAKDARSILRYSAKITDTF